MQSYKYFVIIKMFPVTYVFIYNYILFVTENKVNYKTQAEFEKRMFLSNVCIWAMLWLGCHYISIM